jgi:hypothetical protein
MSLQLCTHVRMLHHAQQSCIMPVLLLTWLTRWCSRQRALLQQQLVQCSMRLLWSLHVCSSWQYHDCCWRCCCCCDAHVMRQASMCWRPHCLLLQLLSRSFNNLLLCS